MADGDEVGEVAKGDGEGDEEGEAVLEASIHPLFADHPKRERLGEIRYVTFMRRTKLASGKDGPTDWCPVEFRADEITSWADVVRRFGGGWYKAVAKNAHHTIVAYAPHSEWIHFAMPQKPWTDLDGEPFDAAAEPDPLPRRAPAPGPDAAAASQQGASGKLADVVRHLKTITERLDRPAPAPAAPSSPPADSSATLMTAMVTMMGNVMTAVLNRREAPTDPHPRHDPVESGLKFFNAFREATAAHAQPQRDLLGDMAKFKELLTSSAGAAPAPGGIPEIDSLFGNVFKMIQLDQAAQAAAPAKPSTPSSAPPLERRPRTVTTFVPGVAQPIELVNPSPDVLHALHALGRPGVAAAPAPAPGPQPPEPVGPAQHDAPQRPRRARLGPHTRLRTRFLRPASGPATPAPSPAPPPAPPLVAHDAPPAAPAPMATPTDSQPATAPAPAAESAPPAPVVILGVTTVKELAAKLPAELTGGTPEGAERAARRLFEDPAARAAFERMLVQMDALSKSQSAQPPPVATPQPAPPPPAAATAAVPLSDDEVRRAAAKTLQDLKARGGTALVDHLRNIPGLAAEEVDMVASAVREFPPYAIDDMLMRVPVEMLRHAANGALSAPALRG